MWLIWCPGGEDYRLWGVLPRSLARRTVFEILEILKTKISDVTLYSIDFIE